jgi:hypothetical protein
MLLGHGIARMALSMILGKISFVSWPILSIIANKNFPFEVSRSSKAFRVSPTLFKNPSTATSGASTLGPRRSCLIFGCFEINPSTTTHG